MRSIWSIQTVAPLKKNLSLRPQAQLAERYNGSCRTLDLRLGKLMVQSTLQCAKYILRFRCHLCAYLTRQAPAIDRGRQARAVVGLQECSCGSSGFGGLPLGSLGFLVSHIQLELHQLQLLPGLTQLCLCLIHLSLHACLVQGFKVTIVALMCISCTCETGCTFFLILTHRSNSAG